ncbi:hypothetical protein GCM10027053_47480 [Intrasporangium mesophilum]
MRLTNNLVKVAFALMTAPDERHWGYELMTTSGVRAGAMYPMLAKLLKQGWIADGWEDPAETRGRPPRRYYVLTKEGQQQLGAVLVRADARGNVRGLALRPRGAT